MRTKFRGRSYGIRYLKRIKSGLGQCENPASKRKIRDIEFSGDLFTKYKKRCLEVLIHEAIHACFWDLAERAVESAGKDIAKYLKKLGVKCDPKVVRRRLRRRK